MRASSSRHATAVHVRPAINDRAGEHRLLLSSIVRRVSGVSHRRRSPYGSTLDRLVCAANFLLHSRYGVGGDSQLTLIGPAEGFHDDPHAGLVVHGGRNRAAVEQLLIAEFESDRVAFMVGLSADVSQGRSSAGTCFRSSSFKRWIGLRAMMPSRGRSFLGRRTCGSQPPIVETWARSVVVDVLHDRGRSGRRARRTSPAAGHSGFRTAITFPCLGPHLVGK